MAKTIMTPRFVAKYQMTMHMRPIMKVKSMSTLIGPMRSAIVPESTRPMICSPVVTDITPDACDAVIPTAAQ